MNLVKTKCLCYNLGNRATKNNKSSKKNNLRAKITDEPHSGSRIKTGYSGMERLTQNQLTGFSVTNTIPIQGHIVRREAWIF